MLGILTEWTEWIRKIDFEVSSNKLYFVSSVNVSASLLFPFQDELMQESVYSLFVKHIGNSGCLDHYIFYFCLTKYSYNFTVYIAYFFPVVSLYSLLLILDLGQLDHVTGMLLKFIDGHLVERIRHREFMKIVTCSSRPLECIQENLLAYSEMLLCPHWLLCELDPCFCMYEMWRDEQMLSILKGNLPCFELTKSLKSLYSSMAWSPKSVLTNLCIWDAGNKT